MAEEDQDIELAMGDGAFSLAALAGINSEEIAEVRRFTFPTSICKWKCEKAGFKIIGSDDKKNFAVEFSLICLDVLSVADKDINPDSLVGQTHQEFATFNKTNPLETLGRAKAFMADAGFRGSGDIGDLIQNFAGTEFGAKIGQYKRKDDPDKKGASIGLGLGDWTIVPLEKIDEMTGVTKTA